MNCLEEAITKVPGLSGFQEGKLPAWMKEKFQGDANAVDLEYEDQLNLFRNGCVSRCGMALIDGQDAMIFETLSFCPDDFADVAEFAYWVANDFVKTDDTARFCGTLYRQST